mmetsp:Transcript_4374/g.7465  ORF Transcript_4374/g.7465 Transcript_4374/m.7465 type:complete len:351 (-) Transcript_4374:119-1171(-)
MTIKLSSNTLIISAVLFLQCGVFGIKSPFDPPPVIIRLDDVTGGWCEEQSIAAMETAINLNTPINAGLIGVGLDTSELLVDYLGSIADNPLVEIVSHSYYHNSFEDKTLEYQVNDLKLLNDMANKLTNRIPMTFIPPRNEFDDNTILALQNNTDYHILSAQCNWVPGTNTPEHCKSTETMNLNVVSPNIKVSDLYVLPTGAVLGDVAYWENYLLPASVENATAWIDAQIDNQGFGVLMLHPVEFATDSSCAVIAQEKIQVFADLIKSNTETIPGGKWRFMLYHDAVEYLTGDVVVQSGRKYDSGNDDVNKSLPFLLGILGVLGFMVFSCLKSYYAPEIKKAKDKMCYSAV